MLRLVGIGLALVVLAAVPVDSSIAHHSVALYSNDTIELEGELVGVEWQNPHIEFTLRVAAADGTERLWRLESSSIFLRQRDGVTRDLFRVGDHVKVAGRPSTRDAYTALATNMLLPDGREAPLWPQASARFGPAERLIKGESRVVDAAAENKGLFRVWLPPIGGASPRLPFTGAAIEARRGFDIGEFAQRCEPEGMPRIMHTNVFPRELVDRGSVIELKTELFDTVRTIHMDVAAPSPVERPSRLGYSVGRWDGGRLVVRTTLVDWPYFDNIGTPQSAEVEIVERFSLSADQERLDYEMTVVDAATFESPATITSQWRAYAGEVQRYDCQPGP
jgi:hypothetical protein